MTSPSPAISARNLTLTLGSESAPVQILRGIDLDIPQGQICALLGPSGSGKSSLMAVLSGLERASGGTLSVAGADEPTGNLDVATGHEIIDLLFARRAETGATLLVITHDPELAARCDRVVSMADGVIANDTAA